jgi:hypothetical protein
VAGGRVEVSRSGVLRVWLADGVTGTGFGDHGGVTTPAP